jgi:NADH:ubiquinone oxidoreductase subunit F (NADH-binding)
VVELMAGRPNLPVTSWGPEAVHGHRGRPTLLSNAETFAHVALLCGPSGAAYAGSGTADEPGTRLLTIDGESNGPRVVEVPHGTPWRDVLAEQTLRRPILLGGYHGTWAAPGSLTDEVVSRQGLATRGLTLGAGAVLPLGRGDCPVHRTAAITAYLAQQSAGRCGPCVNGLPALAEAVRDTARGTASRDRAAELARVVTGRGACAHPDGTARLVASMLSTFGDEVAAHAEGTCTYRGATVILTGTLR